MICCLGALTASMQISESLFTLTFCIFKWLVNKIVQCIASASAWTGMLVLTILTLANTVAPLQSLATMLIYVELSLKVHLVGEVEKWEERKYFNFSLFCLVKSEKVEGWKKWVCINLLIYSFKKWCSIKKNDKQPKK